MTRDICRLDVIRIRWKYTASRKDKINAFRTLRNFKRPRSFEIVPMRADGSRGVMALVCQTWVIVDCGKLP